MEADKNTEIIQPLSNREIEKMRQSGRMVVDILSYLAPMVQLGVSTLEINNAVE